MSLACPLYAQSASNRLSNDLVFCSESLGKPTCEATDSSCADGCKCWDTDGSCSDPCRPLWSVNAGAVILHRSTPQSGVLVQTSASRGNLTLLDASDFKFGWSAGADIGVTRRVDKYQAFDAIDFRYFGVQDWQADTSIVTGNFWRFPSSGQGVIAQSAQIDSSYFSQLQSAELNVQRDSPWSRLTWLAGVRWIGVDERLNMSVFTTATSFYTYSTHNSLYGGQIGAALRLWEDGGPFQVNCVSKAGLYGNSAANRYDGVDSFGNYALLSSDRKDQLAFVGDIGVTATYQWTKHLAVQGGYQLLWIQGVANAGNQSESISIITNKGIASNGGTFYHGAMASTTLSW
jgi:hypothetical protein